MFEFGFELTNLYFRTSLNQTEKQFSIDALSALLPYHINFGHVKARKLTFQKLKSERPQISIK